MKSFFKNHSYDMVKMFLNQFATAIFGFVLALSASYAKSAVLRNVTSAAAVLFYLFLLYTMTWEIGYKERTAVQSGSKSFRWFTGGLISLCANSINFLLAIFIMLAQVLPTSALGGLGGVSAFIALLIEGQYLGLLVNPVFGAALNSYWLTFFVIPLPAIITCTIAYNTGFHDLRLTSWFHPVSPELEAAKKEQRKR